jgi:glycosyltransferase involved in cell wall biosynthesis
MRILTNEYLCNTPNFKKPAKGGPANFSRLFFDFLMKESKKNEWVGVVIRDLDQKNKTFSIRKLRDQQTGRSIYKFSFPHDLAQKILKAKKTTDPEKILSKTIDYLAIFIEKINPDIVFLNGFSLGNWILLKAAHQAKKPIAIQHAGIWTVELEIYKDFFSLSGVKIMKEMERDSSRLADAEIFLNDFSRRFFAKNVYKKTKNAKTIKIIPLPVDIDFFKKTFTDKKLFNFNKDFFNIGTIARWDRIKNHQAIADLAALIDKQKISWKIHVVTKIPETKKAMTLKNKYRKHIDIVGHLTKEGVKDFFHSCNLVILPSNFDVSPGIVLEAMACGKMTAISKNVGFIDDYVKNGAKDWIIDFNNPQKAIAQINKIKGKSLPEKLKRELFKKHQAKKVFKQYTSLFKDLSKKTS